MTNQCKLIEKVKTEELKYVSLPLQNNSNCGEWVEVNAITKNMVCAGYLDGIDGKGGCTGDSGGPLVLSSKTDKSAIIYGVVSFVTTKARFINNR